LTEIITTPQWVQAFAAVGTFTVALLVGLVAYLQWRTNQNKLKLDLFEKRYAIYAATQAFFKEINAKGRPTEEGLHKFYISTRDCAFLLNEGLLEYLNAIHDHGVQMIVLTTELEDLAVGPERTKKVKERSDELRWMYAQADVLAEKFTPFLRLSH
jgi:hypothetical protein